MTTGIAVGTGSQAKLTQLDWLKIGLKAALLSVAAVLLVQVVALSLRPGLVQFKPLDSYPRTVLFTAIPALIATAVFAWLTKREGDPVATDPVAKFLPIAAVVLVLSFIPDFALPLAGKTLLGSTVAAGMHAVAGIMTVATIVFSYRRQAGR
jgi:hypothetical protein